jgi:hypothetical protein
MKQKYFDGGERRGEEDRIAGKEEDQHRRQDNRRSYCQLPAEEADIDMIGAKNNDGSGQRRLYPVIAPGCLHTSSPLYADRSGGAGETPIHLPELCFAIENAEIEAFNVRIVSGHEAKINFSIIGGGKFCPPPVKP